jgi:NAD(P)-dependent dehydrogenase (short-subunit alcohol dehydrogenase family)
MANFEGKVALVTGGGSGLGEAISKDLAKNGVKVVVTDINLDAATRVAGEITAAGGEATPFQANTMVAEDSKKSVDFAVATYGALNYAVNNAGIGGASAPTGEIDLADWDRVIGINLNGVLYGMRYQIPEILKAGAAEAPSSTWRRSTEPSRPRATPPTRQRNTRSSGSPRMRRPSTAPRVCASTQ